MDGCDNSEKDGIISPAENKKNFLLFDRNKSGDIDLDEFVLDIDDVSQGVNNDDEDDGYDDDDD